MIKSMNLHYEERGAGTVLINLHGWPAEHGQMMAMMEPLFQRPFNWRRIYPDLSGMGKSPGPKWLVSHDQMLDVVSEFVEDVAPHQQIALAGHSYGALLARGLMHRHPDRVAAAFLLSPAAPADAPVRAGPPRVFAEDPQFDAELTETERAIVDLIHVRTLPVLHLLRTQEPSRNFSGPVLILSGRQEPAGHNHIYDLLAEYLRATCAILDRTGHLLFAEQPALLTALATEWLDRVEEAF